MMYLRAITPSGKLHASTCADAEFEAQFRATMLCQGLRIESYTLEEYQALLYQQRQLSPAIRPPAQPDSADELADGETAAAQTAELGSPAPVADPQPSEPALPEIGQLVIHPMIGYGIVTHVITLEGQSVPVMVGPNGSSLVRPDQWQPATEADRPAFLARLTATPATCATHQITSQASHHAPLPVQPKRSHMPSLF